MDNEINEPVIMPIVEPHQEAIYDLAASCASVFNRLLTLVNEIDDPIAYAIAAGTLHHEAKEFFQRLEQSIGFRIGQIKEENQ